MGIPDGNPNYNSSQSTSYSSHKRSGGHSAGGTKRRSLSNLQHPNTNRNDPIGLHKNHNDDSSSSSSSEEDGDQPYRLLPFHGEHRRAVSSVAFSPAKFVSSYSSSSSSPSSSGASCYALCASASADGTVKLWDIRQSLFDQAMRDPGTVASSSVQSITLTSHPNHTASAENTTSFPSNTSSHLDTNDDAVSTHTTTNNHHTDPTSTETTSTTNDPTAPRSKCLLPITTLCGHSRGINDVAWSPRTGEVIATASDDKTLRLWDVTRADGGGGGGDDNHLAGAPSSGTGSTDLPPSSATLPGMQPNASSPDSLVEFKGHSNFCFSVRFSPQANLLVSGSFDETVKLWDVRSGECVSTLPAHSDPVTGVDFNRDGTCVVSSSHDGLVRVWDVATGECLKTIYADGNPPVSFVRYSPNGRFVLSGTLDGTLRLWNVAGKFAGGGGCGEDPSLGRRGGRTGMMPEDEGSMTASSRGTGCTKTYTGGHVNAKYCVFSDFCVSNPRRLSVVTGSEDGRIYLYDLQTRAVRQVLEGGHGDNGDPVLAVASHPNKELLASGGMSNDRTVRFWAPGSSVGGGGEDVSMEQ